MLIYILAGLYGLVIGSFLNVCIYRIPAGMSVVKPRSRCNSCGTTLNLWDLVPVFSWLSTSGRCRYCHKKIAFRYTLVEILTAALTVLTVYYAPLNLELIWKLAFTYIAIVIAFIDWDTQEIPEILNLAILALGLSHWLFDSLLYGFSWSPLLGGLSGFMSLFVLLCFGAMGGGDVKYMGAAGFLLGLSGTLMALYLGFIIGGIVAMVLLFLKKVGRKSMIAFGPYLVLASWLVLIYQSQLILIYKQLFMY